MKIHPAGYHIITKFLLFLLLINGIVWLLPGSIYAFSITISGLSLFLFLGVLMFFRRPKRKPENLPDETILCPADGTIVVIEEVMEPEYFKDMRLQVSIFMSITNVHINWYPLSGVINYVKYHAGKYLVAWHPKSSELNERNSIVIENHIGEIMVRQVAGFIARKIYSTAKIDQKIERGHEIGMIKFGSRVDLYLPLGTELNISLDEKVRGGETIIGKL
ncbi:MAG: phosphatidylserine decarboxylase family protein [Bacteroidota bacterium]